MNIYARYFDHEALLHNLDELVGFLSSLPDINVSAELVNDLSAYLQSSVPYPKRYKVRPRVYFILIKTNAETMDDFKGNRKYAPHQASAQRAPYEKKPFKPTTSSLTQAGWYKGEIYFKRVIRIPGTGKYQYQDTAFAALVRTESAQECYNRIVTHLRGRDDVDARSQFPSIKGQNFSCTYLGELLPDEYLALGAGQGDSAEPIADTAQQALPASSLAVDNETIEQDQQQVSFQEEGCGADNASLYDEPETPVNE